MKNHQNINADSGNDEYFTPQEIIESARRVMGGIRLDPASSETANKRVMADRIFTVHDNGLIQNWEGSVWMNHPFGKNSNKHWIEKICSEYASGRVSDAICICFAATSEKWFRPLLSQPQCFIHKRTNYFMPDGTLKKGVTKGSVVTYFGNNLDAFHREFKSIGTIKIKYA